jgi:hypothetical protein
MGHVRIPFCNRQEVQTTGNVRDNDCSELAAILTVAFRGYVSHACTELLMAITVTEKYVRIDTARMRATMPLKLCGKGKAKRPRRRWEVNVNMDMK